MTIIFSFSDDTTKTYNFNLNEVQYNQELNVTGKNNINLTYVSNQYSGKFYSIIEDLLTKSIDKINFNINDIIDLEFTSIVSISYDISPDNGEISETFGLSYSLTEE